MRSVFLIFILLISSNISLANVCTALMLDSSNSRIKAFKIKSDTRAKACDIAVSKCYESIAYDPSLPNDSLRCVIQGRTQRRYGRTYKRTCSMVLKGKTGRHIEYFQALAYGQISGDVKKLACTKALRNCNHYKQRNGHYRATCETSHISRYN